jgi:excisionase family DNA binding protein
MVQNIGGRSFVDTKQLFENEIIQLISVEDLARFLALAPKTIRNYVWRREIPFVKIGKKVMFRPESIAAWLEQKETPCR